MKIDNNIAMVLSSCDKYEDTWAPFFIQLHKYWPNFSMPVYLSTETKSYSFSNFKIECPLSKKKVYKQWSERLLKLLESVNEEYILFMLDDFWLTETVDTKSFLNCYTYLKNNSAIGFICLKQEIKDYSSQEDKNNVHDCEYPELWECSKEKAFRITTQAGIWRKKYLIKLLRKHESAWYFETRASWRSKFYKERVFDTKFNVLTYPVGGTIGGGKLYEDYLNLYPEEVYVEVLKKRGTIKFGALKQYPKEPQGIWYYYSLFKSMLPKW